MNQEDRRQFLIRAFQAEGYAFADVPMPHDERGQRELLRALMNVRQPGLPAADVLQVQDDYLRERACERGVVCLADLQPVEEGLYLWQGDITLLVCDAIVNAANSGMTGCWAPCHACIDNSIHTFAGVQLRAECAQAMDAQGHPEPTGQAKVTSAYNLPSRFVVHTVGPIVDDAPTERDRALLASSYRSCYEAARAAGAHSLAFCCISTGVFRFPSEEAAAIALSTVRECRAADDHPLDIVFNVFLDADRVLYEKLLVS